MSYERIAFIGLGNMGKPMAINLAKAGRDLMIFDINADACDSAIRETPGTKMKKAASPTEAVANADLVITMLPSSPHVQELYLGTGRLIEAAREGTTFIDCSTIAPEMARLVATAALKKRGVEMVDAPVSGGTAGAAAGTLTFIVGGTDATFAKVKPVLAQMGKNIFHAGGSGTGQVAKICNNMLLAVHMIGTSEALALGQANGMDAKVLSDIMAKSSGRNWSLEVYNPVPGVMDNVPSSREYQGGFAVDLMAKDLGLAQEAALATKSSTPLGSLATQLYRMLASQGLGRLDFSSVIKLFEKKS